MYLKINPKKITGAETALIVKSLMAGEVIVYPTDTIYGLGCLATNEKAIKKIKAIKKREASKPLLILVSSLNMAKKYCFISKKQEIILKKVWANNRPTSVILKQRNLLAKELAPDQKGLAIRLPKSDFLRKIIRMVRVPIVSTSFNLSGEPVLSQVDFFANHILTKNDPNLIVDSGTLNNQASKIVDLMSGELIIVRQ
ncbi:MAG: L-threonylcarbamoyladenylate synthase [Candidatus Falkowbacteria bacterium]